VFSKPAFEYPQDRRAKFSGETPTQQAKHREIADRHRRKKRRHPKINVRIAELSRFADYMFGTELPFDDEGADFVFVLACHLARLDKPEVRIREMIKLRAPWYRGIDWVLAKIRRRPIRLNADNVAKLIGLNNATRNHLAITTIGAIDCGRTKRKTRRRNNDAARHRALRAEAGAKPHATSLAQTKPWKALKVSRRTYFRRRQNGTGGTNSSAAIPTVLVVKTKQCHDTQFLPVGTPCQTTGAPPPQGGVLARAVSALSDVSSSIATEAVYPDRIFPTAARARGFSLTSASSM
jgi:hypothetical protein